MKIYKLNQGNTIGGYENRSEIYIKSLSLDINHEDNGFHIHPDTDEYYIILDGSVIFEHTQGQVKIESSEVVCFSRGETHRISKVNRLSKVMIIKLTECSKI